MPGKKKPDTLRAGSSEGVDSFLATLKHPAKQEILALRKVILGVDRAVGEGIKWNAPSFFTREHFATFQLRHKGGVQIILHMGVKPRPDLKARGTIDDPESMLEWKSADRALVTFRDLQDIEARKRAFVKVLRQWIAFP